jgi:IMP dehydrogenase
MGYCGVTNIADMQEKTRMVQASSAAYRESHPHDVLDVADAPNYYKNAKN